LYNARWAIYLGISWRERVMLYEMMMISVIY